MEKKELIEQYFKTKYPDERYVMKNYYHIQDTFNSNDYKLYVIEFIDTKVKRSKTMELQVKEYELLTIKQ